MGTGRAGCARPTNRCERAHIPALPPPRTSYMMIRPNMKEKACQTEVRPEDPIWDVQSSVMWAGRAGCVVEDARTASMEVLAQISDHLTLARKSCQEP
eukprot:6176249-Pleurochrysis_carterae.AAC.1